MLKSRALCSHSDLAFASFWDAFYTEFTRRPVGLDALVKALLARKISLLNACTVLVFFIAGLLSVALRARRPLGAYRIPPETGLLIPSDKR